MPMEFPDKATIARAVLVFLLVAASAFALLLASTRLARYAGLWIYCQLYWQRGFRHGKTGEPPDRMEAFSETTEAIRRSYRHGYQAGSAVRISKRLRH